MQERRGFYESRIFPWLNDKLNADPELERIRAEAIAPARGRVLEIGFGTGLNLPLYTDAVRSLVAVEPNGGMHERARPRLEKARFPVQVIAGVAESLPVPDKSFDTAVSVLTLCSVADPDRAVQELRRVLHDDGKLVVLEHGLADEPKVARWQKRLNGIQMIVACGCHLTRGIADLVQGNGFRFENLRRFYAPKMPHTHGWITLGTAVKA
jgi:ubiquinone/menaquinone biosynthesis C-methylase UbiE